MLESCYESVSFQDSDCDRGTRTPLRRADLPGVARVDDWPRWDRLRSPAAGLPGTSSLGPGSGATRAGVTQDSGSVSPRRDARQALLRRLLLRWQIRVEGTGCVRCAS